METFSALLAICAGNSPVNSPHKGQWRGALMFPLICIWVNDWVNSREVGDLRRYRDHNDVTVMMSCQKHYDDVTMGAIASQITSLAIVYSAVYADADQRKHESSASLAFVWGIHRNRWNPRTKGQLRGKCFHLMTSSWDDNFLPAASYHQSQLQTTLNKSIYFT